MKRDNFKVLLNIRLINVLYKFLKKLYKYMHKCLTANRALVFFIKWNIKEKKKLFLNLQEEYNISNIKPYQFLYWKHKVCYFTGKINGENVFIKTSGEVDNINREINAIEYACANSEYLKHHIPTIYSKKDNKLNVMVENLIDGESLYNYKFESEAEQREFVLQLFEIYNELKKHNLYHLDIRPNNFIVHDDRGKKELFLIDFGYALVNSTNIYDKISKNATSKSIIKDLGSNFAPKNGFLDDSYSMLLTMKYVCPSLLQMFPDIWKVINDDIDNRCISIS